MSIEVHPFREEYSNNEKIEGEIKANFAQGLPHPPGTPVNTVDQSKWRILSLLAVVELMAMGVWFSASAVVPELTIDWRLDDAGRAWLTMSVQTGFVAGTFVSALLNLADLIPSRKLLTYSCLLASLSTALIPLLAPGLSIALPLRFLTGLFLAGVYPVDVVIRSPGNWPHRRDLGYGHTEAFTRGCETGQRKPVREYSPSGSENEGNNDVQGEVSINKFWRGSCCIF